MDLNIDQKLRKLLEILASTNNYVPGPRIASMLGISRSMVNRLIEDLRSRGFLIESHPRRGYRLLIADDLRLASTYVCSVGVKLRYSLHYVDVCESTQDIADALASQGASEGVVVVAEEMTRGRGRLGRRWIASRGGLWFTVILRPMVVEKLQLLTLALGVAVVEALEQLIGVKPGLKWPNDVVYDDRKLAGILVEAKAEADVIKYVLAGIGLNVNNDLPDELRKEAISLKEIMGVPVPRIPVLRSILSCIDRYYRLLLEKQYDVILDKWRRYSVTIGRRVRVYMVGGGVVEGVAEDVAKDGSLVVRLDNGVRKRVYAGDVVHLR